jgi:acyl-[acyl-carrier-protein]-phospholipid O-acyltransferase/long-chain-fatty-acid--[acyl-carrier-protein] ligase
VAGSLPVCGPLLAGDPRCAAAALLADGWGPGTPLLAGVVLGLLVLGALCWIRPQLLARALLWLAAHTLYRVRVHGREHLPPRGGALLVCNQVTFVDWLLIRAALPRPVRFVVFAACAGHPFWGRMLRWTGAIPIDGSGGPKSVVQALRAASDALNRGELVCLVAQAAATRTGFLLPFHRGFEQVQRRSPAVVVPVCLDQVWGSAFRYQGGRARWRWPQEVPYPVSVTCGPPLPGTSSAAEVCLAIQKVSADGAIRRIRERLSVHRQFVRTAARNPLRPCFIDPYIRQAPLSYGQALAGAWCLARRLRTLLGPQPVAGVWLPPGLPGALANIALALLGKTSVNLNYTAPAESLHSAIRQCGLRHVLTSRRFTDRLRPEFGPGVELLYLEDIIPRVSGWERFRAYLAVLLLPGFVLDRWVLGLGAHAMDDVATIIFSSGSTGEPKGVMLTHANIAGNVGSMIQAAGLRPDDRALGVLPFFHSFGYTVTLWAPLQVGASLVYYFDPRQAKEIGELCRQYRCSIFLTTPTFLRFCLRRSEPEDFRTLRLLITGAEKLPPPLAREFGERFGVQPLEGYGCTELAPVVSTNLPDEDVQGVRHVGNQPGTIGRPLPGVAARVADPDTLLPLPPGREGVLLVYGPNVMRGYLGLEAKTREVVRDGWYVTGDMARIEEDGFIRITGRLSRFAKIAGEMVPLQRIEEELHGILQTNDLVCAVTAVPDDRKGERVVVLHLPLEGTDVQRLSDQLAGRGLSSLGLPGERDFYQIPEIPVLGSGKLDLQRLKELALERAGNGY